MDANSSLLPVPVALQFFEDITRIRSMIAVSLSDGRALDLPRGMLSAVDLMEAARRRGNKMVFIGNGGSASIASHQAIDY